MDKKYDGWLVTWIDPEAHYKYDVRLSKESAIREIKKLVSEHGIRPSCIRVFPPKSNLTATELLLYEEEKRSD